MIKMLATAAAIALLSATPSKAVDSKRLLSAHIELMMLSNACQPHIGSSAYQLQRSLALVSFGRYMSEAKAWELVKRIEDRIKTDPRTNDLTKHSDATVCRSVINDVQFEYGDVL